MHFKKSSVLDQFLSSYNEELLSKVSRLDELIGRDHWLSVGNYKESILRKLISNLLPQKYEVSTGFIVAFSREGELLKSRQMDMIIWDSVNFAPIFRDDDFVIVPPESCSAVVEVKGMLNSKELHDSLLKIDSLIELCLTAFPFFNYIGKYIFAYDISDEFKFPNSLWQVIANNYTRSEFISLDQRMKLSNENRLAQHGWDPLFSVDGIYVLPEGAIRRDVRKFDKAFHFMFEAYSTVLENSNHTYAYFESNLQAHLATNGKPGLLYSHQPGLLSVKRNMKLCPTSPKSLMIFPKIENREILTLYDDIREESVFVPR